MSKVLEIRPGNTGFGSSMTIPDSLDFKSSVRILHASKDSVHQPFIDAVESAISQGAVKVHSLSKPGQRREIRKATLAAPGIDLLAADPPARRDDPAVYITNLTQMRHKTEPSIESTELYAFFDEGTYVVVGSPLHVTGTRRGFIADYVFVVRDEHAEQDSSIPKPRDRVRA